jgi:hypothetical protein
LNLFKKKLIFNSEILRLTVFTFTVEGRFATSKSLNTLNRFGRADCGMEKLFLEFTAVGDHGAKQQNLVGKKV